MMELISRMFYLEQLKIRGAQVLFPGIIFWIVVWIWMFATASKKKDSENDSDKKEE